MAVQTMTVNPSLALTNGPDQFAFPAGITKANLDQVKFFGLLLEISRMFGTGKNVLASGDTLTLTVSIDGTND